MTDINQNLIIAAILQIKNKKDDSILNYSKIESKFTVSKYSSTKESIWHILIDDKFLKKSDEYTIKYKCITCSAIHEVCTTQFLRKFNKGSVRCYLCRNKDEEKRKDQSLFMLNNSIYKGGSELVKEIKVKTLIEKHTEDILEFEKEDAEYINNYYMYHLTQADYNRLKPNIISFCNGKYKDLSNIEFWDIYRVSNQMKYSSIMYDKINDTLFKPNQPILKCDVCDIEFRSKSLENHKNNIKIFCSDCKLCNRTYKIRFTKNINNEKILYQSKLELKFIDWCNNNQVIIYNGPNLKYNFKDKDHVYKVDFRINNILVETKDDHIWHRNEIKSGKWAAKVSAVDNEIKKNNYKKYFVLTPKNWDQLIKQIKQDIV
jgi:hypothetical protein